MHHGSTFPGSNLGKAEADTREGRGESLGRKDWAWGRGDGDGAGPPPPRGPESALLSICLSVFFLNHSPWWGLQSGAHTACPTVPPSSPWVSKTSERQEAKAQGTEEETVLKSVVGMQTATHFPLGKSSSRWAARDDSPSAPHRRTERWGLGHDPLHTNGATVPVLSLREITMPGEGKDVLLTQKNQQKMQKQKPSFAVWCLLLERLLA